jgi:alkylation response protein AidB-like acyl-CoA dehydrogenase
VSDPYADLRHEVRTMLAGTEFTPRCDSWMRGFDAGFSRAVGTRGWIGMTWPTEYGGGGRSGLERLVVTEELLRAGAPVAAHWTADRQIGPTLLRHGTEQQRRELLPAICAGDVVVCLGMSEADAGSDLSAVRTRAVRADGGWRITGTKIWTTSAHRATHAYVLARAGEAGDRHTGLTEFLLDMARPGITVRPILDLVGEHHFNEVVFDDVEAHDDEILGAEGQGWAQVTGQLAFERGGPERYLSTYPLLAALVDCVRRRPDRAATETLGRLAARLTVLRRLSWTIATAIDAGTATGTLAAELKLLGTDFEKDVVEAGRYIVDVCGDGEPGLAALLTDALVSVPGGSIRGGTSEIMRTLIGRSEASG